MSDLFHEQISEEFIFRVFLIMRTAPWHRFQILTKRPERLLELNDRLVWAPNIWMGVTVENQNYCDRIEKLKLTGAQTKFISFEPLIGPIPNVNLDGINWVIVGGESGPGARPMQKSWITDILNKCQHQGIPFFFFSSSNGVVKTRKKLVVFLKGARGMRCHY
jgi:protein gp37